MGFFKNLKAVFSPNGMREVLRDIFDTAYEQHLTISTAEEARGAAMIVVLAKWYEAHSQQVPNVNDPRVSQLLMAELGPLLLLRPPYDKEVFVEYLLYKKDPSQADAHLVREGVRRGFELAENKGMKPWGLYSGGRAAGAAWINLVDEPPGAPSLGDIGWSSE